MQYLESINSIEFMFRIYRKGCITYGEFVTNIGSAVVSFEHEITRDDTPNNVTDLSAHEGYRKLVFVASETLRKAE